MAKFMLSLRDENFRLLINEAEDRGISIQELIRAVIIPDWVKQNGAAKTTVASSASSLRAAPPNNGREQLLQPAIGRVRN